MYHIGEALRIRVKKFKHNLTENYSKSTKIAITACKFSKIFRGSVPPDSLELFLILNQLQISSAEKKTQKKCGNYAPLPFKISRYANASPGCRLGEKIWSLILDPTTLKMLPPSLTWTRNRWTRSFSPNSNLNSKKYFFWTRIRTWTRIKLFEFIGKIFKLLKKNKRSVRNIVCCSSSHNPCKLRLWFYQKKSCMSFICSCRCDLLSPGLRTWTRWTRSFSPNSNFNSDLQIALELELG